jgi:hypothetical protein
MALPKVKVIRHMGDVKPLGVIYTMGSARLVLVSGFNNYF